MQNMSFLDLIFGEKAKPFSLTEPQFDQSTFYGRWRNFLQLISISSQFYSTKTVYEKKELLEKFRRKELPKNITDKDLWLARWIVESSLHPDTGRPINRLFRLSSFIPMNCPILIGMLLSEKTQFNIAFWQAINQTYNVGFNYCNRNESTGYSNVQLFVSYIIALTLSVIVGLGMDRVLLKYSSGSAIIRTLGPILASSIAGGSNLLVVRFREIFEGIDVFNVQGEKVGTSRLAAKYGLLMTLMTRTALQFVGSYFSVIAAKLLEKLRVYPNQGSGKVLMDVLISVANILFCIPVCFALVPQIMRASKLEPELKSENGFYFNRGL